MKIGILTFSCAYNYGAMLQCYALQEYLYSLGCEVKIINYRPSYLTCKKPEFNFVDFLLSVKNKHLISYSKKYLTLLRRYNMFRKFESKYLNLTEACFTDKDIFKATKDFHDIIIGSDQVWCSRFNGEESIWFGSGFPDSIKIIFYAVSAGNSNIDYIKQHYKQILRSVHISVRERELREILCNLSIYSTCVLDPTLMAPQSIWKPFFTQNKHGRYILVRQARPDDKIYYVAKELADRINCRVITADVHDDSFKYASEVITCNPFDFVSLVKNACCVITNSFHGLAVSIITETNFYVVKENDGYDERSRNLLKQLYLEERMIEYGHIPEFCEINYSIVNKRLEYIRNESQRFLTNSI